MPKLTTPIHPTQTPPPRTPAVSQQPTPKALQWVDSNGKNRQITLQQLEKWLAVIEKTDPRRPLADPKSKPNTLENNTLIAADFLARFGLQASNILVFLESPAATPILALYTEALHEIAEQEALLEQMMIQEENR